MAVCGLNLHLGKTLDRKLNLSFKSALPIPTLFIQLIYFCFPCHNVPTNSVVSFSGYKHTQPTLTKGLTLETSALKLSTGPSYIWDSVVTKLKTAPLIKVAVWSAELRIRYVSLVGISISVWETPFYGIMQAGQKLGIVYIGKAGGKVSAESFDWFHLLTSVSDRIKNWVNL